MSRIFETSGSMTRTRSIAKEAIKRGHEVYFCAGEDINYRPLEGVKNFKAPIPSPFGLPKIFNKLLLFVSSVFNIEEKTIINDFEQVLFITGAINKKYFVKDIKCVRDVIKKINPDIIFTENRISPIVAAKLENVKVITIYSAPIDYSRHVKESGKHSKGVKKIIQKYNLPKINTVLDILDWAAERIVPSSSELEPIKDNKVNYIGTLIEDAKLKNNKQGKNILVYMGVGTISIKRLYRIIYKAFHDTDFNIYFATKLLRPSVDKNIIVDGFFDFNKLMEKSTLLISHGGQNSIMQSLLNGIPMLFYPGTVFERDYNADRVVNIGAGEKLVRDNFTAEKVRKICNQIAKNEQYRKNAYNAGKNLICLGGAKKVLDIIES